MKRSIPVIMSILNNQSKEFDNMSTCIISSWLLKVAHWPQLLLSQNPKNPETLGWKTIGLIPCLPYNSTFLFLVSVPQASRTVLCWALWLNLTAPLFLMLLLYLHGIFSNFFLLKPPQVRVTYFLISPTLKYWLLCLLKL